MGEDERNRKSVVEQIVDEMVRNIQGHTEFDENMVKGIKELADKGYLTRDERIIEVIMQPRAE